MLLHSFLDYWAREQPDGEFAVQHGHRTTYGQAHDAANQLAHAFLAAGLQVGDRIAILAKNRVEFVLITL
jgi:acyl-CoA synthetase (AMP-forming)/AMP-acid ligase II